MGTEVFWFGLILVWVFFLFFGGFFVGGGSGAFFYAKVCEDVCQGQNDSPWPC